MVVERPADMYSYETLNNMFVSMYPCTSRNILKSSFLLPASEIPRTRAAAAAITADRRNLADTNVSAVPPSA